MSPYYKYKKERLSFKFNTAKDVLKLMQSAMVEYSNNKSVHLRRAILGYFQDFSEYIIDMCETYLVMTDNYVDGCSAIDLINRARIHGFIDDTLCEFITNFIRLRNRYTHDYYKRGTVEEDILKCCFSDMMYIEIFLQISDEEINLKFNTR
ncbi:MAG: hypothetical protein VB130_03900 [Clostridium sp.]|nr:hypothetical protein [Clostridium sp.]